MERWLKTTARLDDEEISAFAQGMG